MALFVRSLYTERQTETTVIYAYTFIYSAYVLFFSCASLFLFIPITEIGKCVQMA